MQKLTEQNKLEEEPIETWLRTEVAAAYGEIRSDPLRTVASDEMRAHLAALHKQHLVEIGS